MLVVVFAILVWAPPALDDAQQQAHELAPEYWGLVVALLPNVTRLLCAERRTNQWVHGKIRTSLPGKGTDSCQRA